jgi:hypothetical protein
LSSNENPGDFIGVDKVRLSVGAMSNLDDIRLGGGADFKRAALQGMRRAWLDDLQRKYTVGNNATETPIPT